MTTSEMSGADLARMALRAAKDNAKRAGTLTDRQKREKRRTIARTGGRDPQPLGNVLAHVEQAYDWKAPQAGASIIDRWQQIAPSDVAGIVRPTRFDAERGVLHVQPATYAAATMLRLQGGQLVAHLQRQPGGAVVRALKVEQPGGQSGANAVCTPAPEPDGYTAVYPAPPTGAPPTPEVHAWREQHAAQRAAREAKPDYGTHPLFADAYGRLREDPAAFTDAIEAMRAAGELPVDDAERRKQENEARQKAALAMARSTHRTGDPTPIRAIGAA